LTCSGRFTHISGHPLAVGRAQDTDSSPVTDQRSISLCHATIANLLANNYSVHVDHSPGQENNNTCRRISAAAATARKVLISVSKLRVVLQRAKCVVQFVAGGTLQAAVADVRLRLVASLRAPYTLRQRLCHRQLLQQPELEPSRSRRLPDQCPYRPFHIPKCIVFPELKRKR